MFGAFFYGFVDQDDAKSYTRVAVLAKKMDRNDFMFSNSPYSLLFDPPTRRGPVVVHSDSPPSPPMTLDSPMERNVAVNRQREVVGAHVCTDPGVEGLDQFGTNTFGVHTWMVSPPAANVTQTQHAEDDVETDTEFARQRVEQVQHAEDEMETDSEFDRQRVERTQPAEEEEETDTEFENQRAERRRKVVQEARGQDIDDVVFPDVIASDDNCEPEEAHNSPDVVTLPMAAGSTTPIMLSDDEEIDHPHSSDNDDEADGPPTQVELKPVIAPSGVVVKVEKDWWRIDKEARERRIARKKDREEKERLLAEALASNNAANEKIIELREDSDAKFSELKSQFALLLSAMQSQASQSQSCPLQFPSAPSSQPPLPSSSAPIRQEMEQDVPGLPYPRVEDKDVAVSLAREDYEACTPASQSPRIPSPHDGAFAIRIADAAAEVCRVDDTHANPHHYPGVDDNVGGEAGPSAIDSPDATMCEASHEFFVESESPVPMEEERVDYEPGVEDLLDNAPATEVHDGSAQVQPSDPYDFD